MKGSQLSAGEPPLIVLTRLRLDSYDFKCAWRVNFVMILAIIFSTRDVDFLAVNFGLYR